jgi:hypothetical protein
MEADGNLNRQRCIPTAVHVVSSSITCLAVHDGRRAQYIISGIFNKSFLIARLKAPAKVTLCEITECASYKKWHITRKRKDGPVGGEGCVQPCR